MNSWEKNSISPEFHPATKPLTVEPVDSGNEIDGQETESNQSSLLRNWCCILKAPY